MCPRHQQLTLASYCQGEQMSAHGFPLCTRTHLWQSAYTGQSRSLGLSLSDTVGVVFPFPFSLRLRVYQNLGQLSLFPLVITLTSHLVHSNPRPGSSLKTPSSIQIVFHETSGSTMLISHHSSLPMSSRSPSQSTSRTSRCSSKTLSRRNSP